MATSGNSGAGGASGAAGAVSNSAPHGSATGSVTAASGTTGGATGTAVGSANSGGATSGSGPSGSSGAGNAGSANSAKSGHVAAGGTSFVAQLTSGSPVHLLATPDSLPLNVAVGLLLVGGIALGPSRRRYFARVPHPRGAHFTRAN